MQFVFILDDLNCLMNMNLLNKKGDYFPFLKMIPTVSHLLAVVPSSACTPNHLVG